MNGDDRNDTPDDGEELADAMTDAVHRRQRRRDEWRQTGERPPWRNLSMIGALGWLIITPTLAGVFLGRWLDLRFASGVFWTGSLIFVGVVIGSYLAWKRIEKE